ncbi:hypothetical protein PSN45_004038 [Yamadazyma tenuis]|uniref:Oleate-induced peroxisomal protein POX18 n=1 Tax=Candida tenuis (strain ATCC 10573 / BCRC 21748 / CBS 615 / JCM 9827 / NBRC 10315 / NRRL Y-1498 / VKM Y-70) TaxID=590646 RepID=G3B3X4_CANTC|nr:oleate-induced peroxisomal protein POX18 [Yamadazyma tenuis ATCC 10573]EGV63885.1 oleate-induced peroxisomal protein POX18 [Yamadazyma tenuis ATCC 10573]WEJ96499.1 hypothetical protein PSN45_004038 [Yamadazyma tenuis]
MSSLSEPGFEGTELLDFMKSVLDDDEKLRAKSIKQAKANVILTLKNKDKETKSWFFEFKNTGEVRKIDGTPPKADVALFMADKDFLKLVNNEANPQKLYMSGKLKIKGNLMKAVSLEKILRAADPRSKL